MKRKKIAIYLVVSLIILNMFPAITASAYPDATEMHVEEIVSETVEFFEDGSYLTVTVTQEVGVAARASVYEQSGTKYYILRNKDGAELWRFALHGTFSVNSGVSATCTKTTYSSTITDNVWELSSAATYASGNKAMGGATFVRKQSSTIVETRRCNVTLTCDENGILS